MADPVSLASGLLTLIVFAHKSCFTLCTTIHSFKTQPKRVRDLVDELQALTGVLESLSDTARSDPDLKLPALELPFTTMRQRLQGVSTGTRKVLLKIWE